MSRIFKGNMWTWTETIKPTDKKKLRAGKDKKKFTDKSMDKKTFTARW